MAEWLKSRLKELESTSGNPILQKREREKFETDLNAMLGKEVEWKFKFTGFKQLDTSKVRLYDLKYTITYSKIETNNPMILPLPVGVQIYDPGDAEKENKLPRDEIGVTVPLTSEIASLRAGDSIVVHCNLVSVRRSSTAPIYIFEVKDAGARKR